ncbi:MAG: ABC transporter permease [Planctomycetota bacterium]|nr:ABC transporter permease [Planctomycetota bacterium]
MRLSDTIAFALTNLSRQKLRSGLTAFGVVIGAGAIVLLISLGIGLERAILKQFEVNELLNMVTVLPAKVSFSLSSILSQSVGELNLKTLDDGVVEKLRAVDGVKTAYPDIASWADCRIDDQKSYSIVWGLPPEGISEGLLSYIVAGGFWKEESDFAVVPTNLLKRFKIDDPASALGKTLIFSNFTGFRPPGMRLRARPQDGESGGEPQKTHSCTIVGVFDSKQLGAFGDRILVPATLAKVVRTIGIPAMAGLSDPDVEGSYGSITVRVADPSQVDTVRKRIEDLGYGTFTSNDIAGTIGTIFLIIQAVLGCIGGVGMIVAFFGIVNTMVMAILERTREIGVLKSVGARDFDIWGIFVAEAGMIAFVGSIIGLGCAWGIGELLEIAARAYIVSHGGPADTNLFAITWHLALGVVGFSVIVGVLAGLYPAARAARLEPVTALRHD